MSMAPPVTSTPVQIHSNIKQERRDDSAQIEKLSPRQQIEKTNTPIPFSITNILSNTFGHTKPHINNSSINLNNNEVLSEKKNNSLFRPYDDDCSENGAVSPKETKMDRRQQSDDEESNGEFRSFQKTFLFFLFAKHHSTEVHTINAIFPEKCSYCETHVLVKEVR